MSNNNMACLVVIIIWYQKGFPKPLYFNYIMIIKYTEY